MTLLALALAVSACSEDEADRAAAGVARLTVANLAAAVDRLVRDTRCGFAASEVFDHPILEGEVGRTGRAIWRVEDCALELDADPGVTDCSGVTRSLRGHLTVTASMTLSGQRTGRQKSPILPAGPEALEIALLDARFDDVYLRETGRSERLIMREGSVRARARPRLYASASTGVCEVPTPNLALDDIRYDNANLRLEAGDGSAFLFVPVSDFSARVGEGFDRTNNVRGKLNFFTREISLPDDTVLDPSFDPAFFRASWGCTEGLREPHSDACGLERPDLAQGIARLSIQNVAAIAALIDSDVRCGFSAPNVLAAAKSIGTVGRIGALELETRGCVIEAPSGVLVDEDCKGTRISARGRIEVTARRRIVGRLTGDLFAPVIPIRDDASSIFLDQVSLDGFVVENPLSPATLTLVDGTLSATVTPRLAARSSDGVCAAPTPIARVTELRYQDAVVGLESAEIDVAVPVEHSALEAVIGVWPPQGNVLRGEITLAGRPYSVPINEQAGGVLEPFDPVDFDARWQCGGGFAAPISFRCDPQPLLIDGFARLSVHAFEVVQRLVDADASCGFAGDAARATLQLSGAPGAAGSATWTLPAPCVLDFPRRAFFERDCRGLETYVEGRVTVRGSKIMRGQRTADPRAPVRPSTRFPLEYRLDLSFDGFSASTSSGGITLTALEGDLSGIAEPLAVTDTATGACVRPVAAGEVRDLEWSEARTRLAIGGLRLELAVSASSLGAVRGRRDDRENMIRGVVTADGSDWAIPVDPRVPGLESDYDPETFERRFSCAAGTIVPRSDADCR